MLRILTYHRVAEPESSPQLNPRMISATPAGFERQMRLLAKNYRAVSMGEVLAALQQSRPLPPRAVLITFDDAYCDFGEIAWPLLKKHRLPVTLFVPTGYPDRPEKSFWWDRLYRAFAQTSKTKCVLAPLGDLPLHTSEALQQSLKQAQNYIKTLAHAEAMALVDRICAQLDSKPDTQKSVLSWPELRQLVNEGVTLGAHTVTHPIMTQLSPEDVRFEIAQSQSDLQREIGTTLPIFCYPSGGHDDSIVALLQENGFRLAFTTLDGQNDLRHADLLRLRRTNITRRTSLPVFRLRLLRGVSMIDAWRHRA